MKTPLGEITIVALCLATSTYFGLVGRFDINTFTNFKNDVPAACHVTMTNFEIGFKPWTLFPKPAAKIYEFVVKKISNCRWKKKNKTQSRFESF